MSVQRQVHGNNHNASPEARGKTAELFTGAPAHEQEMSKLAPKRLLEPGKLVARCSQKNYFQQIKTKAIWQKYSP